MGFVNEERTGANYYVKSTPKKLESKGHFDTMVMISDPSNSDSLNSNSQSPYPLLQHKFQLQGPNLKT